MSLLTIVWSPQKIKSNFKDRMNGHHWPWHNKLIKSFKKILRVDEKWRMNENVEECKTIYCHKMSQDYKLGQGKCLVFITQLTHQKLSYLWCNATVY